MQEKSLIDQFSNNIHPFALLDKKKHNLHRPIHNWMGRNLHLYPTRDISTNLASELICSFISARSFAGSFLVRAYKADMYGDSLCDKATKSISFILLFLLVSSSFKNQNKSQSGNIIFWFTRCQKCTSHHTVNVSSSFSTSVRRRVSSMKGKSAIP